MHSGEKLFEVNWNKLLKLSCYDQKLAKFWKAQGCMPMVSIFGWETWAERIKEFKSFQRMFAKNIREQRWLENGEMVENV